MPSDPHQQRFLFFKVNRLGDNLVSLPTVQALRRLFPNAPIRVYTDPIAAEIYEGLGVDLQSIPLKELRSLHRRPHRLIREISRLRQFRPTAAILPLDQPSIVNLFTHTTGLKHVVGGSNYSRKIPPRLTRAVKFPVETPIPLLDWQLLRILLEELQVDHDLPETPPPPDLSALLQDVQAQEDHVVIHPGGSIPVKRWFFDRFLQLAEKLSREIRVMWIHHGDSAPVDHPGIATVTPRSLGELTRLLASASLFVGNNSGPMHFAAALGIPSLILCGPSRRAWDPIWNTDCIRLLRHPDLDCLPCDRPGCPATTCTNFDEPMACMDYWTVDKVLEKCFEVIGNSSL